MIINQVLETHRVKNYDGVYVSLKNVVLQLENSFQVKRIVKCLLGVEFYRSYCKFPNIHS